MILEVFNNAKITFSPIIHTYQFILFLRCGNKSISDKEKVHELSFINVKNVYDSKHTIKKAKRQLIG